MTTTEQATHIGKTAIFTGQTVAAQVTIRDARTAFGRVDFQVEDCQGKRHWVSANSCKPVKETQNT